MQNTTYHKLKNTSVRDLYWLLFSEGPLSESYNISPYTLFPQQILEEWKQNSKDYFLELDKNPNSLILFVNRKKNKRLGFYAEALLSYFFQTFNSIELLLQNFQIIDQKKTVGEVDFIILYKEQVIHLECAVKYYLLKDSTHPEQASNWVGPRMKDNLELKLEKLIQHQLPLGSIDEVHEKLNRSVDQSYLFLKGVFFTEEELPANEISKGKNNQFIRQSSLIKLAISPIEILTRPNWLSATAPSEFNERSEFMQLNKAIKNPELVLFEDHKARFVVPDNWGKE
ncbi:MAG TPA: DUF1853 family protein [Brumimicrobium sp.]|nr:DUF1853 family protein [Brumimicrobium sp.]